MKKSFFRGFCAGILTLFLTILVFAVLAVLFQTFIWPIISGVPYISNSEPILVGSKEWYLLQSLAFSSAVLSGVAIARWSKPDSWYALLAVLIVVVSFTVVSSIETDSILNLVIWHLEVPVGLLMGFYLFNKRNRD